MSNSDVLGDRGRALEEEFFRKQEEKILAGLREAKQQAATREALAKSSGISNPAVLDLLSKLNVHAETVAALALVPLIEVAWADGKLDEKEAFAILQAAEKSGVVPGNACHALLKSWLAAPPRQELMAAWINYVQALCSKLDAAGRAALKGDVLTRARAVAHSAGGILGLGSKISPEEQAVLTRLEGAF